MSIIETKFRKGFVETPELRTNGLFINKINMNDILFGAIQTITNDARKTLEERGDIVNDTNPEQVLGFRLPITEDLIDMPLISLTLRREDTVGNATSLSNFVYAYVDCFNEGGDIVHTFYSFNSAKQQVNDGLETTWYFVKDNIISEFYNKIEFRFTTTYETRGNATVRSTHMTKSGSNSKLYIQGWDTMYPNQAEGREWQNYTSDISVSFQKEYPSIQDHLENEEIHVTAEDKERWNNSTVELNPGSCIEIGENNTISVKTADALAYDENTVPTNKTVYLEMGYVLTDAQTYADEAVTGHRNQPGLHTSTLLQNKWNKHVDDDTIHVTADDKTAWNSKIDQSFLDERLEEIENLLFDTTSKETTRNTKDVFAKDGTGSAARLHAWDMKTAEYVGEYLTQVTIYRPTNVDYIDSSDILHNNPQWLSVECLDVDGNLLDTYFSNDKDSQKDGEDNTTTWNFNEIKIKEEYHKLRFRVTTQENVLENQPQSMKRAILCYTYTNIPDTNDWGVIEQNNTVRAGHTMYFQFKTITKKLGIEGHIENEDIHVTSAEKTEISKITPLKTLVDGHIGDSTHLTEAQKTAIGKVGTLETSINNHIGDDTHVTTEEKTNWNEHVNDTDIHITVEEKDTLSRLAKEDLISEVENKIDLVRTTLDEHIGDFEEHVYKYGLHLSETEKNDKIVSSHIGDDTHVTQTEKSQIAKVTNIQSNIEELETKYNDVTTILNNSLPDIETFSTLDSGNYKISSSGKSNATGVQLSREHFTTGSIKVVEICHIDGINANDIRLCAIVFNHGENENTPKSLDDCIFSVNTQNQVQGIGGSMCFRFNNLELPNDYEFVRFLFAKGDTVIPVHNNAETVIEARVQVLARNVDNGGFDESPDDECKVMHISSTSNWYPHVRVMKTVLGYNDIVSLINRVSQLEARVSELENS